MQMVNEFLAFRSKRKKRSTSGGSPQSLHDNRDNKFLLPHMSSDFASPVVSANIISK